MRRLRMGVCLVAMLCILSACAGSDAKKPMSPRWARYEGAWFSIGYPSQFKVCPSLKSRTSEGYDSAFFRSPDGLVEFYIFSPQWNGNPSDIQLNPKTGKFISRKITKKGPVRMTYVAIKAKNGAYIRYISDTEHTVQNTHKVFGIKCRDRKVYDKYKSDYEHFKSTYTPYGD